MFAIVDCDNCFVSCELIVDASDEFTVWGKVIFTIRDWRNSYCLP